MIVSKIASIVNFLISKITKAFVDGTSLLFFRVAVYFNRCILKVNAFSEQKMN